jgi:hypothetical protein
MKQEVLGRTNRLFSFDTTWTAYKTTPPTILRRCKPLPSNDRGIHGPTDSPTRTAQKVTRPTILILLPEFLARERVF